MYILHLELELQFQYAYRVLVGETFREAEMKMGGQY